MSSLREIRDRIASVRSTLKITSAMKLVSSSKLRKAQRSIESLRPYEEELSSIYASLASSLPADRAGDASGREESASDAGTAVLAFAGNSSMCGAFNSNVIKKTLELLAGLQGPVEVLPFGRKMAEAMRKAGYGTDEDRSALVSHPDFESLARLSSGLRARMERGELSRVLLVYNHFVSTGRQVVVVEDWTQGPESAGTPAVPLHDYILEPSAGELLASLRPRVLDLKLYAALLDSCAAEHAARMVAMQAATDNAQELLASLSLEYNKGRQFKITSEILDLAGGQEH